MAADRGTFGRALKSGAPTTTMTILVKNWKGEIQYRANTVERVSSVQDIVAIVTDTRRYPSPVRAKGSHHSTTDCVVAEGGTVVDLSGMNEILEIDGEACTIRMQAGVLHIDAARELEAHGLQFFVNVEIGNLTVGSGACGATAQAAFGAEIERFQAYRHRHDPGDRFYTDYFRTLFEPQG